MEYSELVDPINRELHEARHTMTSFGQEDENPLLDWGTAVGFLLGIHYSCSYQRPALRLNKALFVDGASVEPTKAIDVIAAAIAERVLKTNIDPEWRRLEKLRELAEKSEGEATQDTPYWPLPEKPWERTDLI